MKREFSPSEQVLICPHGNPHSDCGECSTQGIVEYEGQFLFEFPDELVTSFSEEHQILGKEPNYKTNKGFYYKLFEKMDPLVGVPEVMFRFSFLSVDQQYKDLNPPVDKDQYRFGYYDAEQDYNHSIASMEFIEHGSSRYQLFHRFVDHSVRNLGVGLRLLKQSELFFKQLADIQHEDIACFADAGQISVMRFLEKAGYSPSSDQLELYQDFR
jgi:GNAT superfamily N-acetyltransferase